MIKVKENLFNQLSLLENIWELQSVEERLILSSSQKNEISVLLAKLLLIRDVNIDNAKHFLEGDLKNNLPNPFLLLDMNKSVNRIIQAIKKNEKIGIIADYDVDGSTSAAILIKFLSNFNKKIFLKIPNRLLEGYGPNLRIMDEFLNDDIDLIITLDCGTSSFNIIDNKKYSKIDIMVIDHHLSELILPKVFSVVNPNRFDEDNEFNDMAAVGVTFLFLMALRKKLREINFFNKENYEPNLFNLLDLVALGTVCDVVKLKSFNRAYVKAGLELIKKRKNLGITSIIDNSNLRSTPTAMDLGYIIGPQLNAASRLDDSNLPSKLLLSNDLLHIEKISKKLLLLNEKRKLIESSVFEEALIQANNQKNENFILVYGDNWHNGVLGIVASKLINKFNKPSIVISFTNSRGIGSARSLKNIDLGNIILEAKNLNILTGGGGHKMAAGLQINFESFDQFYLFLKKKFNEIPVDYFKKIEKFDSILSVNEINDNLLEIIDKLEPYGSGNPEPKFIIYNLQIDSFQILKEKHLLLFFQNEFSIKLKAICFNCIGTILGDYLTNYKNYNISVGCTIKRDIFNNAQLPQIIIKDVMIIN